MKVRVLIIFFMMATILIASVPSVVASLIIEAKNLEQSERVRVVKNLNDAVYEEPLPCTNSRHKAWFGSP